MPLPVAAHPETLRILQTVHDTVFVIARDSIAHAPAQRARLSWETVLTFIALIVVPLVAVLVGAREGGRQARKAAAEEFRRQTQEADDREKARVKRRMRHDVEAVNHVEEAMVSMGPLSISPALVDQLMLPWLDYRHWRDSSSLFRDPEYESGVTQWYDVVPLAAGLLREASNAVIHQLETTGRVDAEWTGKAAGAIQRLQAVAEMGRGLLKDLQRQ